MQAVSPLQFETVEAFYPAALLAQAEAHRPVAAALPSKVGQRASAGWIDRLAAWAERQPQHHRMGSWTSCAHIPSR